MKPPRDNFLKKILFIAPRLPFPVDTGAKIRTFNILKQLAGFAEVELVCFSFEQDDKRHAKALLDFNISTHLVPAEDASFIRKASAVVFHKRPFSVWKYYSPAMEQRIKKLANNNAYDAVHIDHIHMAHYRKVVGTIPAYIDEHNVECQILERCARVENNIIKKWLFKSQARKMMAFEKHALTEFTAVFAVSEDDADILRELISSSCDVYVVTNGVDTSFFNPQDSGIKNAGEIEPNSLVFTGSMDWLPNEDAVIYFCDEILPLIWQKNPAVKLYIVGKNPSETLQKKANKDNRIMLTGRVDDVRSYIVRCPIFVVPLRIGGGTRLKILEAMSMERAVVSTTIGAEGIAYKDGDNIAIADSPRQFREKILELIHDQEKTKRIGKSARKFVCETYDWSIIGTKLQKIYT